MVHGSLSDDHMIQLKMVTGTLNSQKYQDQILESGVRSPLDSLDGQSIVLQDDIARPHFTRIIEEYKNQQNIASISQLVARLEPYPMRVGQARLTCLKRGTCRIKTIVNFARLYCLSGTGLYVLDACTQ